MEIEVLQIENAYNENGCGYRLIFLIIYNRKSWFKAKDEESSILLNRRLNKLIEYWNFHGNTNGKDNIIKKIMFVPMDTIGGKELVKAIETEKYGYYKREYLSKDNLYYKDKNLKKKKGDKYGKKE